MAVTNKRLFHLMTSRGITNTELVEQWDIVQISLRTSDKIIAPPLIRSKNYKSHNCNDFRIYEVRS